MFYDTGAAFYDKGASGSFKKINKDPCSFNEQCDDTALDHMCRTRVLNACRPTHKTPRCTHKVPTGFRTNKITKGRMNPSGTRVVARFLRYVLTQWASQDL